MTGTDRDFLERSLADLDRELLAGDLSPTDHERLRREYERRLQGQAAVPDRPPARRGLVVAGVAFVIVVGLAAGVLLARAAGRRTDGGNITGDDVASSAPPTTVLAPELARCLSLAGGEAIECFTGYTESHPDDPKGFVQFGLFAVAAGMQNDTPELFDAAEGLLDRALEIDPADVDALVYRAVLLDRLGRADEAAAACADLAAVDVPERLRPEHELACG